jgi:hypothetical protein
MQRSHRGQAYAGAPVLCASETPTAPGKLKRSKLSDAKVSAWVFSDVLIHTLAKEPL